MKVFKDFKSATNWIKNDVVKKGSENAIPIIAEQIYKDSNEFTYRESGTMYQSGEMHSNFEKGLVIERTPYVRRRYFQGGERGKASPPQARPRWFEEAFNKHKEEYKRQYVEAINKAKKG